jgi:hypothetical protein
MRIYFVNQYNGFGLCNVRPAAPSQDADNIQRQRNDRSIAAADRRQSTDIIGVFNQNFAVLSDNPCPVGPWKQCGQRIGDVLELNVRSLVQPGVPCVEGMQMIEKIPDVASRSETAFL